MSGALSGIPGLSGYMAGEEAAQQESIMPLQRIGSIMGILSAQEQLKKARGENAMQDEILNGGQGRGILSGSGDPAVMRAVGMRLALAGHPGGATLVTAADKAERAAADRQSFQQMKSQPVTMQPDPQEVSQSYDQGTPQPQPFMANRGGLFSTLSGSPFVGDQARMYQGQLDSSKEANPEQQMKHYERLFSAHQLATENANKAAERTTNLPVNTVVVQDRSSPTGWSHLDKRTMERIPGAPPPQSAANMPSESIVPAQHRDVHGADYLSTLPPAMAEMVKGVAEGRVPLSAASMRFGNREALMQRVMQYDPAYNQTRPAVWKDFTSGKTSSNITALNTAVAHMGSLDTLTDALKNGNVQGVNMAINTIRTQLGKPEINNAQIAIDAVGAELMRVFRQVGASEKETKEWASKFNATKGSPEQLKGALKTAATLLQGRLDAVNDQWKRGMGTEEDFPKLLSPKASDVLQRLNAPKQAQPGSSQDGMRSTSKSGKPIVLRNGQWEYE